IFLALLVRGLYVGEVRLSPTYVVHLETGEYLKDPKSGTFVREVPDPATHRVESVGQALLATVRALLGYFVYMVIIIVVAVPEGLPMSVTVSLALAMRKMTRANALVRQLVATETIGSATVICSDKTGTLTQNRMTVVRVGLGGRVFEGAIPADFALPWYQLVVNAAVNSTASLEEKEGKTVTVGNTTEGALLHWLRAGAWSRPEPLDYVVLRSEYPVLYQVHFSSDRKRMTTVAKV